MSIVNPTRLLQTRSVLGSIPALAIHFCSIVCHDEQFRHFAEDRGAEKVGRKEHPNTYFTGPSFRQPYSI
jgi:hypothetical protein